MPRLYGSLPRDHRLENPDTRALWQQRIDEELVGEVIVHPQLREREPWMTTMGDLRSTWGYGLILSLRYKCTDYDRFIDMVCLTVRAPLQVAVPQPRRGTRCDTPEWVPPTRQPGDWIRMSKFDLNIRFEIEDTGRLIDSDASSPTW